MTFVPPPGSRYQPEWYIPRPELEQHALGYLVVGDPVLFWGPRDQGCTWLSRHVARAWRAATPQHRVAIVDFRRMGKRALTDLDSCLRAIAVAIAEWLDDGETPFTRGSDEFPYLRTIARRWDEELRGPASTRLTRFAGRVLDKLPADSQLLVLFDHADLVHSRSYYESFAGLLRNWAERARHQAPWDKLRLMVSVSIHPARLRTAKYESPFANLRAGSKITSHFFS